MLSVVVMGGWNVLVLSFGCSTHRRCLEVTAEAAGALAAGSGHWPSHPKENCPLRTPATLPPVPSIRAHPTTFIHKMQHPLQAGAFPGTGPSSEGAALGEWTLGGSQTVTHSCTQCQVVTHTKGTRSKVRGQRGQAGPSEIGLASLSAEGQVLPKPPAWTQDWAWLGPAKVCWWNI